MSDNETGTVRRCAGQEMHSFRFWQCPASKSHVRLSAAEPPGFWHYHAVDSSGLCWDTALPLQAEDKLIDGIKFRLGMNTYSDDLKIDGIGNIAQKNKYINSKLVFKEEIFSGSLGNYQRGDEAQGYLVITLPETRVGKFMFKGWNIDWIFNGKVQNLPPAEGSNQTVTVSGETLLRQDDAMITSLTQLFQQQGFSIHSNTLQRLGFERGHHQECATAGVFLRGLSADWRSAPLFQGVLRAWVGDVPVCGGPEPLRKIHIDSGLV